MVPSGMADKIRFELDGEDDEEGGDDGSKARCAEVAVFLPG